jgi:hypothetical protein
MKSARDISEEIIEFLDHTQLYPPYRIDAVSEILRKYFGGMK